MGDGIGPRAMRLFVAVCLATLVLPVFLTGCGEGRESEGETLRIGAVLSLSGSLAGMGEPARRAIEVEVERINAEGGVNGRTVEVLFEDDATDEAKAVAATSRLIEQDGVLAIIGGNGTGPSMAMRQEIERSEVPQVALAGGSKVTDEFSRWVFQTPWPNRVVVPVTLRHLQAEGITRLALIVEAGGYGQDGRDVTESMVADFGIEVVAAEQFNRDDTDMTPQITKIRAADPDAVLMWAAGAEAATILKNNAAVGGDDPLRFFGGPGNGRLEFVEGAGDAAEGFEFAAGRILLPETYGVGTEGYEVAMGFIDRYTERWGEGPDTFAGHAYDAIHIIVEAMRRLPVEFTPAELRDEIERTTGLIAVGGTFTFSETDHNGMSEDDLIMYHIAGGVWIPAEEV